MPRSTFFALFLFAGGVLWSPQSFCSLPVSSIPVDVIDGGGSLGGGGPLDTGESAPTDFFFTLGYQATSGAGTLAFLDANNFTLQVSNVAVMGTASIQLFGVPGTPATADFDWILSGLVGLSGGTEFGALSFSGDPVSLALDDFGFPGKQATLTPPDVLVNFATIATNGVYDIGYGMESSAEFDINPVSFLPLNGGAGLLVEAVVIPLPPALALFAATLVPLAWRGRRAA